LKLLSDIIFLKRLVLLTIVSIPAFASSGFSSTQQVVPQVDTAKRSGIKPGMKPGLKSNPADTSKSSDKIEYSAKDSTKVDKKEGVIYLYGRARVVYQGLELDADYITYNTKTHQIFASGKHDAKGKYVGRPIFKMPGQGSSLADSLRYNTETAAGKIYGVFTEQEGGFFSGGLAKKQPDDEIHSKGQTYSTCNLPHPHFGIHITKGIVTENQIITGPVYLKIEDIPLPIGLPFAFFPKPNKKSSGIILPSPGEDYTRGFFLRDGGYYMGFSDYFDAKLIGSIYTGGSYDLNLTSTYTKRYKYNGNIALSYSSIVTGSEGTKSFGRQKPFAINWSHNQNANASPGSTLSASVNIRTSSYNSLTAAGNTYDPIPLSQSILTSSVNYSKQLFGDLFNLSLAGRVTQDVSRKSVDLTLPDINLTMSRQIFPFASPSRVGDPRWYEKISVGYSMVSSNAVTSADSLLFKRETLNKFRNGMQHNIPIQMNFNVLKYFNFGTSVTYRETWHFQSIKKTYLKATGSNTDLTKIDTIPGFNRYGTYSIGGSVGTKIYSTAQFTKLGNLKAIRHVMSPNIGFSYSPDFSDPKMGNYLIARYQDGTTVPELKNADGTYAMDANGNAIKPLTYARQEGMLYQGPPRGRQANMSFTLQNTVEAKVAVPNDTTGKGEKKVPIINNLSISTNYNFLAPKFKLSPFSISGSTPFTPKFQVNYNAVLNPYLVGRDSLVNGIKTPVAPFVLDKYVWQRGKLPRLTSFGLSFDYSLNPEALKRKNINQQEQRDQNIQKGMTPEQAEAMALVSRDPNAFVDFKIPWNFAFRYAFNYNTNDAGQQGRYTNSLSFNGDANITPKWKVTFNSGWDFQAKNFTMTTFGIYRDLHCWDMSFSWVPFGAYQSYSVDIKVKASVLQDLKLSKRKNYYTRY
jgi:lipopolysaccharide assembly outer membrane protein LptD (OstA)